ncbi:MAG TPA: hypothetical protein VF116_01705 [Ktedonobacterales bacterium]
MPQNVERGMVRDDERLFKRQIVELLANPRIGPVSVAAIAANLGVSPDRIASALDTLVRAGQLICVSPDAYTAPPVVDGQPLQPHPYLASAATPLYVPEALRGDWLLAGEGKGTSKDAKGREGREEEKRITTEETEATEGRAEGEQRATAEDAEDAEEGRQRASAAAAEGGRIQHIDAVEGAGAKFDGAADGGRA